MKRPQPDWDFRHAVIISSKADRLNADLAKLAGENVLRVLRPAEDVADPAG